MTSKKVGRFTIHIKKQRLIYEASSKASSEHTLDKQQAGTGREGGWEPIQEGTERSFRFRQPDRSHWHWHYPAPSNTSAILPPILSHPRDSNASGGGGRTVSRERQPQWYGMSVAAAVGLPAGRPWQCGRRYSNPPPPLHSGERRKPRRRKHGKTPEKQRKLSPFTFQKMYLYIHHPFILANRLQKLACQDRIFLRYFHVLKTLPK